jgi:2-C-methyl-D-erythritol 4-phosphate cytidylyltransferase
VPIGGRPLVAWSLDAVRRAQAIDAIVVAAPPAHVDELRELAGDDVAVVPGGASRSESVARALAAAAGEFAVVHDAARPLASPELFDGIVAALAEDPGVAGLVAAAPVIDTIKRCRGEELEVVETPDRSEFWAIQTPQAFRADALRAALDVPTERLATATDDASLVEAAGGRVRVYPVAEPNPKLTRPVDRFLIEALLRERETLTR